MRILCVVPTYPTDDFLLYQATADAIAGQELPAGVTLESRLLASPGWFEHRDDLLAKHQAAREMVLDEDFDALWLVEADMLPPVDALAKMLTVDAAVVYALYCARTTGMWLCFPEISMAKAGHKSITAEPHRALQAWGQVIDSQGVGMGCTLIRQATLEDVNFRIDDATPFHDDWTFAYDVAARGMRQAHHLGVVCGHILNHSQAIYPVPSAYNAWRQYVDGTF